MEKVVYLAMRAGTGPGDAGEDVLARARTLFADPRYRGVSVQLPRRDVEHARDQARGVVLAHVSGGASAGKRKRLIAMLSLWVDCADDLTEAQTFMEELSDDVRGFAVTETVARDCPGGRPVAGVNAVSLLHRNPALTHDEFLRHWAEVHMPISLQYHPQWRYVRNSVVRKIFGDATDRPDAIAEEGFATAEDLIDPMRFYGADGDPDKLAVNKATVLADVPVFLDVSKTSTFVTQEHVLRTAWTPASSGKGR